MTVKDYTEYCHPEDNFDDYEDDEIDSMTVEEFKDEVGIGDIWDIDTLIKMADAVTNSGVEIDDVETGRYISSCLGYNKVKVMEISTNFDGDDTFVEVVRVD